MHVGILHKYCTLYSAMYMEDRRNGFNRQRLRRSELECTMANLTLKINAN
jgi:hypothetical protein